MKNLSIGKDANCLEIIVPEIDVKPHAIMRGGMIESGIILKIHCYHLKDVLTQMLEDYGEEKIINTIVKFSL